MTKKGKRSLFSLSHIAQELLNAGSAINQDDQGTQLFFERIAKAIETAEGGGQRPNRPMYAGILFGDTNGGEHVGAAPIDLIIDTVARTWLGTASDGSAPVHTIHCIQYYPGQHPGWLQELLGPPKPVDNALIFSDVAQHSIEEPHRLMKTERERIPFERWWQQFQKTILPKLTAINHLLKKLSGGSINIDKEFDKLADHINDTQAAIAERNAPYFSVVVFPHADSAPPEFVAQVLLPILTTGKLPLHYSGGVTDFTRSIVLMTAQDRDGVIPKGMTLGFALPTGHAPSRRANFLKVRKALRQLRWGVLLDAIGDELIIIGPRTKEAQMMLLEHELNTIQQRLEQRGVFAVFRPEFKEWLLWQTREPEPHVLSDNGVWTDSMLQAALERNVRNPLSRVALAGELHKGGAVLFDVQPLLAAKRSRDALMVYPSAPAKDALLFDSAYLAQALREAAAIEYPDTPDIAQLDQHTQDVAMEAQRKYIALLAAQQRASQQNPPDRPGESANGQTGEPATPDD